MPTATPAPHNLDAATARRLAAVAARLASSQDGERLAACAALQRLLEPRGLRLGELLEGLAADRPPAPRPRPAGPPRDSDRDLLARVLAEADRLDAWKLAFARSLEAWTGPLTPKQWAKLASIARGLGLEVAR